MDKQDHKGDAFYKELAKQCQALTPDVSYMILPHLAHDYGDAIVLADRKFGNHPASTTASSMLHKGRHNLQSRFQGVAITIQSKYFGLSRKVSGLALLNINKSDFDHEGESARILLHNTWHALDTAIQIGHPDQLARLRSGPVVPKRSPLSLSRANLKADVFAALMGEAYDHEDSINLLGHTRALDTLLPRAHYRPWLYPYPLALELTKFAWNNLFAGALGQYINHVGAAYHLASEISQQIEDIQIQRWWHFVEPAQDMAWRQEKPDRILGLALNRTPDALLKTTALLVSDIAEIKPTDFDADDQKPEFNAFASQTANRTAHLKMIEESFELVINYSLQEDSSRPLYRAANEQNIGLTEGRIFGWCAAALQAAAKAFDMAQASGRSPEQMARMEFQGTNAHIDFVDLEKASDRIINAKRSGRSVTLPDMATIIGEDGIFGGIVASIQRTTQDPEYQQQLAATLNPAPIIPAARPSGPAPSGPSGPAPTGPAMAPSAAPQTMRVPTPGMGLGGGGGSTVVQMPVRPPAEAPPAKTEDDK